MKRSAARKGKEAVPKLSQLKEKRIRLIAIQYRTGSDCVKTQSKGRDNLAVQSYPFLSLKMPDFFKVSNKRHVHSLT